MNKFYLRLSVIFLFLLINSAQAHSYSAAAEQKKSQTDSLSKDTSDSKSSLVVELDYGTNRGYQLARKIAGADTSQKYISPNIMYEAKSGFFATMAFFKTPGAKKRWDEFLFGAGWDFPISKSADIDGSASYTHIIYNEAIKQNGINPASSQLTAYIKHDFDIVDLKVTGDYYFGGTYNDEDIMMDIDHDFYIHKLFTAKDELSIDPTVTIIAATLNYYINTKVPQVPPASLANTPEKKKTYQQAEMKLQQAINDYSPFRLAYYELALPVNYEIGKFNFEVAWRYDIPDNLPASLNAKSFSYITALVSYDFLR